MAFGWSDSIRPTHVGYKEFFFSPIYVPNSSLVECNCIKKLQPSYCKNNENMPHHVFAGILIHKTFKKYWPDLWSGFLYIVHHQRETYSTEVGINNTAKETPSLPLMHLHISRASITQSHQSHNLTNLHPQHSPIYESHSCRIRCSDVMNVFVPNQIQMDMCYTLLLMKTAKV